MILNNILRDKVLIMKTCLIILFIIVLFTPSILYSEDYIIGEGDVLQISVWGSKELSLSVKVRPDGKITIPALGDVSAAEKSPRELQTLLESNLKRLVKDPVVTVIVSEINNNKVYVFGGGVKAKVIDLNRRTTLLQLLVMLGELDNAALRDAYILRKGKKIKEDFYRLFVKGDMRDDILVMRDDIVFIPALDDKNIYIVGAVNNPKFIVFREGLTVMEAILDAGGFTKYAKENKTIIFRKNGRKEILINVKLDKLMKDGDMSQNIRLQPGDYVVVKEGIF